MVKSRFLKSFVLGVCIMVASSTTALADTGSGSSSVDPVKAGVSEDSLLQSQKKIDQFIEANKDEIIKRGFSVTHTVPIGGTVEIGITPYNEANAQYLYNALGKDTIKVVEGQQAVLMTGAADSPDAAVSSTAQAGTQISQDLLNKQKEIDEYVFESHKDEIAGSGFSVTNTGAVGNYVEIGITPYSQKNADYLYNIFGKDKVKVVEGQQAVTMELGSGSPQNTEVMAASATLDSSKDIGRTNSSRALTWVYALGTAVLLGCTAMIFRMRALKR